MRRWRSPDRSIKRQCLLWSSFFKNYETGIVDFIGELNGLDIMVGDIGNAYLEAYTKEKVCFVAGPEFGDLEGHTLIISKALYGLRASRARHHERFADTLRDMGFVSCKMDPDLWIRRKDDHYEYICVYVDDLMAIMKQPQECVL